MVVSDLPDKQFKIIFIKMLSELRTMHKLRISTKRQKTAKYWTETTNLKNIITELKRLANSNTEKWNLSKQKRKKKKKKENKWREFKGLRGQNQVGQHMHHKNPRKRRKQQKGYSKK